MPERVKHIVRNGKRLRSRPVSEALKEAEPKPSPHGRRLRAFRLGEGLPSLAEIELELIEMRDVLMGRTEPPVELDDNVHALHEYADACFARATEIEMELKAAERRGQILKGSGHYQFRTGELRLFRELAKSAAELGSRRLTAAQLLFEQEVSGRESRGAV